MKSEPVLIMCWKVVFALSYKALAKYLPLCKEEVTVSLIMVLFLRGYYAQVSPYSKS